MRLYNVYINNGWDYDDEDDNTILIVAENSEKANEKAELLLSTSYKTGECNEPYYIVEEVEKVDGFKILLAKED